MISVRRVTAKVNDESYSNLKRWLPVRGSAGTHDPCSIDRADILDADGVSDGDGG